MYLLEMRWPELQMVLNVWLNPGFVPYHNYVFCFGPLIIASVKFVGVFWPLQSTELMFSHYLAQAWGLTPAW